MAALPTAEQNARMVLAIYAHFNSRPDHVLRAGNFISIAARRGIPIADVQAGLEFAASEGWIEEMRTGGLRLTEAGFSEMPQPAH